MNSADFCGLKKAIIQIKLPAFLPSEWIIRRLSWRALKRVFKSSTPPLLMPSPWLTICEKVTLKREKWATRLTCVSLPFIKSSNFQ